VFEDWARRNQKARAGFSDAGIILATMKICRCFARRVKLFDAAVVPSGVKPRLKSGILSPDPAFRFAPAFAMAAGTISREA